MYSKFRVMVGIVAVLLFASCRGDNAEVSGRSLNPIGFKVNSTIRFLSDVHDVDFEMGNGWGEKNSVLATKEWHYFSGSGLKDSNSFVRVLANELEDQAKQLGCEVRAGIIRKRLGGKVRVYSFGVEKGSVVGVVRVVCFTSDLETAVDVYYSGYSQS